MKHNIIRIAQLIFILIGQVHLICYYMAGLIPWSLIFIIISLGTFFIITILLVRNKAKSIPVSITLIIGLAFGYILSNHQDNQREVNANLFIEALNQYKVDNKTYPISEKDLIPKYLTRIPTNKWGLLNIGFNYTTIQKEAEFSIEYNTREGNEYFYTSSMEIWQFGD